MGKQRENLNDNHRNKRARDAQIMTLLVCAKIVREFAYLSGEQIMVRYSTLPGAAPLLPPTWVVQYLLKISNKLLKWKWKAPSWSGKWIGFLPFISFALYWRRVSRVRKLWTNRWLWESNFSFIFSILSALSFYIYIIIGIKLLSTATQWNGNNAQNPWTCDSWAKVKPRQWVSAVGQKLLWSEWNGIFNSNF